MSAAWTPVEVYLGNLPAFDQEEKVYNLLQGNQVPRDAKEVLVYTFITSIGEGESVQRGYYAIYTNDGDKVFKQYMNVATGQGVNIVNSANLWVPMSPDKSMTVKLCHSKCSESENNHIAGKLAASQDWSSVFVIGYRT